MKNMELSDDIKTAALEIANAAQKHSEDIMTIKEAFGQLADGHKRQCNFIKETTLFAINVLDAYEKYRNELPWWRRLLFPWLTKSEEQMVFMNAVIQDAEERI